jgi:hypothetical protein
VSGREEGRREEEKKKEKMETNGGVTGLAGNRRNEKKR